jgi:signal transduction histidine kinase
MPKGVRELTLRLALLAGFGLTLGLWLFAGYQVTRRLERAEREAADLNARYVQAQDVLASVRAQVLLASVFIRDALLAPNPRPSTEYTREVERSYGAIDASLRAYVPVLDAAGEQARIGRLRSEIDMLRAATLDMIATDRRSWQAQAGSLLRGLLPQRERILAVSEEIQSFNRAMYVGQRDSSARIHADLQRQVLAVLGVALALSLAIAVFAFRHAVHLEGRVSEQRTREQQITADLQRLSAGLVNAQDDERRRIARELHDEVGQALSAVNLEFVVVQRTLARSGVVGDPLQDVRALTEGALRSVRQVSQLLHPSALEDLGLSAALGSLLRAFAARTGIALDFRDESTAARPSRETARAVYRITQEAMTNVAKHSGARSVNVRLTGDRDRLVLVIADDGIGFDARSAQQPGPGRGLGLLGISERVLQLGGVLHIESNAGRGTRLVVGLPCLHEPEATAVAVAVSPVPGRREVHYGWGRNPAG